MTLASQSARFRSGRSSRSSRFKRRKKRRNGRIVGAGIVAALVIGGVWWVVSQMSGGGGPRAAGAAEIDPGSGDAGGLAGESGGAETAGQAGARPREILMGRTDPAPQPTLPPATGAADAPIQGAGPAQTAAARQAVQPAPAQPAQASPPVVEAAGEEPSGRAQGVVEMFLQRGREDQQAGRLVQARQVYNAALFHPEATARQKQLARALLSEVNRTLVFSPAVYEGDVLSEKYRVQSGDALSKIVPARGLAIHFDFLVRINGLKNANSLQLGQPLKLVRGPFHAVVDKSEYRIDLYAGDPPSPGSGGNADGAEEGWLYICSFPVGLGEGSGTPLGNFVIKNKDANPGWRNPRTGETFDRNDPRNPIGEHWLGLEGTDPESAQHTGYGLHGTIEPDSIGRDMSMGCVRMAADDIATVWEMLTEGVSVVRIRP